LPYSIIRQFHIITGIASKIITNTTAIFKKSILYHLWGVFKYTELLLGSLGRSALRDTILPVGGGPDGRSLIFAPKGTRLDTSFYSLHHLPEIWGSDAEEFKPSRWDTIKPNSWKYVPFGGGLHACLGQQKATLENYYVIAGIVQEFQNIESCDGRSWQGRTALTARSTNGCLVSLTAA
jgi:hypothetical protein